MRKGLRRQLLLGLTCLPIPIAMGGGTSAASPATTNALIGQRVAGAPSSWSPIQMVHNQDISGVSAVPLLTGVAGPDDSLEGISFYEFPSPRAAAAFYVHPSPALVALLGGWPESLKGTGPVSAESRWLDLELCIYEGSGPNPNKVPRGAPSAIPKAKGKCAVGVPRSGGIASITQRGNVVFVVSPSGVTQPGGAVPPNVNAATSASQTHVTVTLTQNTLTLLHQVGIR